MASWYTILTIVLIQCLPEIRTEDSVDSYHLVHTQLERFVQKQPEVIGKTYKLDFGGNEQDGPLLEYSSSSQCAKDLLRIGDSLTEKWAQKIIDADAKPQSGILVGNFIWLGDFYECRSVVAPPSENGESFIGQYCTLSFTMNTTENANTPLPVKIGICVPSTCNGKDIANTITSGFFKIRSWIKHFVALPAVNASIACQPESQPYDNAAIATICIFSLFGVLIVIGTSITVAGMILPNQKPEDVPSLEINYSVIDESGKGSDDDALLIVQSTQDSKVKEFLKCFCIITNTSKILSMDARNDLLCIHGIRFLSMTWVILGHTYAFAMMGLSGNLEEVLNIADTFAFQAILQGTFSVDSFFLLSGFLLTYLFLKEMASKGKINWVLFYVHRYLRLTPVYALVLAFQTALAIHLGNGPNWPIGLNDPYCRTHWWSNLLYINNFYKTNESCMGWSWYLANDMQFYVISPLFLYPLWRWPIIGISIIFLLALGSWIATGIISAKFDLLGGYTMITQGQAATNMQKMGDYFVKIYIKPYTRISVYLIGVALGYFCYQHLQAKKPVSKLTVTIGWILAIFGGLGIVYGFYHDDMSTDMSAAYNALSRSIFGASLAWLIFACLTGNGGVVNTILSWKIFLPLSRLTYCAYLIHPIIMMAYLYSMQVTLQITNMVMVPLFFGYLVLAYGIALVFSAAFESSLMAVEKMIFKHRKKD